MYIPTFLQYATRWTVLCLERLNYQATERLQDGGGIVRPISVTLTFLRSTHHLPPAASKEEISIVRGVPEP